MLTGWLVVGTWHMLSWPRVPHSSPLNSFAQPTHTHIRAPRCRFYSPVRLAWLDLAKQFNLSFSCITMLPFFIWAPHDVHHRCPLMDFVLSCLEIKWLNGHSPLFAFFLFTLLFAFYCFQYKMRATQQLILEAEAQISFARPPIFSGPLSVFVRRKFQFKPKSVKRFYVRSKCNQHCCRAEMFFSDGKRGRATMENFFFFCLVLTPHPCIPDSLNSLRQKWAKSWEQGDGEKRRRKRGLRTRNAWMASKTATIFNI